MLNYPVVIQLLVVFSMNCDCKSKLQPPDYQLYDSKQLPRDVQVTVLLQKDSIKSFTYVSETDDYELSITISTCTSPVRWSIHHQYHCDNFTTDGMETQRFLAKQTVYQIDLEALKQTTLIHIYISTEFGGPQTLKTINYQNLKLLPKQKRKRLTIKWHSSLVDPQGTEYCLIINQYQHYSMLCQAQFAINSNHRELPIIVCTGRKTQFLLNNLQINQTYFIDLFAINHQTNFIYPYGKQTYKLMHFKPNILKINKLLFIKTKEFDNGKIRYRIGNGRNHNNLYLFIIPCGGIIEIEITTRNKTITTLKRIEGFGNITIDNSIKFQRYYLKMFAMNHEELRKMSGVKVYLTNKQPAKIPFPNMPNELNLKEYHLLKTCHSVTIGWFQTLSNLTTHCVTIREGRLHETDDHVITNQCNLDRQIYNRNGRKSRSYCLELKSNKKVIVHKITNLKAGRNYIVQVTVKKLQGKTLSYNLLQVHTKSCDDSDSIEDVARKK